MDKDVIRIKRQLCCRLCLAPDSECVNIFGAAAADKEPLSQKIQSCVSIKVLDSDRLSARVCHGCISFINAWQSFKNRCISAQKKQKHWLAAQLQRQLGLDDKEEASGGGAKPATRSPSILSSGSDAGAAGMEAYNYYPQYHRKPGTGIGGVGKLKNLIKDEPKDDDDTDPVTVNMELDPTQFLAVGDDDSEGEELNHDRDDDMEEGEYIADGKKHAHSNDPLILNALGLTNVSHVNPYSYLATDMDDSDVGDVKPKPNLSALGPPGSHCRICRMGFSNRANARRHERNLHGIQTEISSLNNSLSNGTPTSVGSTANNSTLNLIRKPTASAPGSNPMRPSRPSVAAVPEVYDYSKPEKYRHLLTESRLNFIRRNSRFLSQYQDMQCRCCNKQHSTYKQFMSHMRKRFTALPRNVCFKCLRKFETKGLFISHLKKKGCLNLYTVYMNDPTIPKDGSVGVGGTPSSIGTNGERIGAKEMLANKMYGCKICNQQYRLKNDFRAHVINEHSEDQNQRDPVTGNCRRCGATFADGMERKRHFSNMDCLVGIICGTCDQEFGSNASFISHVYATHLRQVKTENAAAAKLQEGMLKPEPPVTGDQPLQPIPFHINNNNSMRSPQTCPVCEKQYNNYYNVLRHIETKHPESMPKTYKCDICAEGYARLTDMKDHVRVDHTDAAAVSTVDGQYPCKSCKDQFATEESLKYHAMLQHIDQESYEMQFRRITKAGNFKQMAKIKQEMLEPGLEYEDNGEERSEGEADDDDMDGDSSMLPLDTSAYKTEDLERVRECPICLDKWTDLGEFIKHMKGHVRNENVTNLDLEPGHRAGAYHSRMRCRMCQKRISSKVGYQKHLLDQHQIVDCEFVRCDLCPGEFSNDKGLKVHMYRTHNICIKEDGELLSMTMNESGVKLEPGSVAGVGRQSAGGGSGLSGGGGIATVGAETQFECQICHTVYRNVVQLKSHVQTVHQKSFEEYQLEHDGSGMDDDGLVGSGTDNNMTMMSMMMDDEQQLGGAGVGLNNMSSSDYTPIEVWFQCRYCDDNFSSRQKLTVHMNTHDEHDPTDYTCKECGNVYQSRKSLWVHRNKKHPRPQIPSPCEICKKVFFDKTELVLHLKTHVAAKLDFMNELMEAQNGGGGGGGSVSEGDGEEGEFECHVCNRKFRDQDRLAKHIRIHEMQNNMFTLGAFTEAGMDDTMVGQFGAQMNGGANICGVGLVGGGVGGPMGTVTFEPQITEDGTEEYVCDICPKRFAQLTALKVHRGWHFRSPDGRQITDAGQTWQPGSVPPSRRSKTSQQLQQTQQPQQQQQPQQVMKNVIAASAPATPVSNTGSATNKALNPVAVTNSGGLGRQPKCQFCNSTFASSNNLRRHIVEVHKRNDWKAMREAQSDGGVFIERECECQSCGKTFESRAEWIDHKIAHARVMRPSTTFEWACEICGKSFTRKERLLQHMQTHLSGGGGGSMNQDTSSINSNSQTSLGQDYGRGGGDDLDDDDGEEDDGNEAVVVNPDVVDMMDEDDENANHAYEEEDDDDDDDDEGVEDEERSLSCDLCQVYFEDADELRRHVTSHFINGVGKIGKEQVKGGEATVQPTSTKVATKRPAVDAAVVEDGDSMEVAESKVEEKPAKKQRLVEAVIENVEEDEEYVQNEEDEGSVEQEQIEEGPTAEDDEDEEGEYVEEYIDEDKIKSPLKVVPQQQQQHKCRLCNTPFENNLKALKCMESHRQQSSYPM